MKTRRRFTAEFRDTPIFASFPTDTSDADVRAFVNTVRQILSEMDYLKGG